MKNSEKIVEFIDLNDAAEELELSAFLLAKGLKKSGCGLYLRFDSESIRMGELVFEQHPSHNWDYRIEPRKIYELTAESFRRTIRMLDKNKLCFEGLRIKIEADDLLFNVKIKKVATLNIKGKKKNMTIRSNGNILRTNGNRASWKKAIVTLQDGYSIDILGGDV